MGFKATRRTARDSRPQLSPPPAARALLRPVHARPVQEGLQEGPSPAVPRDVPGVSRFPPTGPPPDARGRGARGTRRASAGRRPGPRAARSGASGERARPGPQAPFRPLAPRAAPTGNERRGGLVRRGASTAAPREATAGQVPALTVAGGTAFYRKERGRPSLAPPSEGEGANAHTRRRNATASVRTRPQKGARVRRGDSGEKEILLNYTDLCGLKGTPLPSSSGLAARCVRHLRVSMRVLKEGRKTLHNIHGSPSTVGLLETHRYGKKRREKKKLNRGCSQAREVGLSMSVHYSPSCNESSMSFPDFHNLQLSFPDPSLRCPFQVEKPKLEYYNIEQSQQDRQERGKRIIYKTFYLQTRSCPNKSIPYNCSPSLLRHLCDPTESRRILGEGKRRLDFSTTSHHLSRSLGVFPEVTVVLEVSRKSRFNLFYLVNK